MKLYFFIFLFSISSIWGVDTTLDIRKSADSLEPLLSIEDSSPKSADKNQKFFKMLVADMKVLSIFTVDDTYAVSDFESKATSVNHKDAKYILRYRLVDDGVGGFKADIKLLHEGNEVFSKNYILNQQEMVVFLVHSIAFDINRYLGGTSLDWMKRKVLFVRLTSPRHSEIVVSDYTLSYQRVILKGGLYSFAKWANKEQTDLYYTSLSDFRPTIYKMELSSGKKEKLISSDGMAVCSDVSEDGKKLLLTLAPNGQPDIYQYDLEGGLKTRLTEYSGIDVNGQFMGDGSIAFVSNRLGYPNLFSTRPNSTAVSQLVFQGKNNSSLSSWKNFLVYKARENSDGYGDNVFNLHLLSLNTGNIKRLTASGENDFPRFSPDGEAILYIKQERTKSSIGVIRFTLNKSFLFPLKIGRIQSIDW